MTLTRRGILGGEFGGNITLSHAGSQNLEIAFFRQTVATNEYENRSMTRKLPESPLMGSQGGGQRAEHLLTVNPI